MDSAKSQAIEKNTNKRKKKWLTNNHFRIEKEQSLKIFCLYRLNKISTYGGQVMHKVIICLKDWHTPEKLAQTVQ